MIYYDWQGNEISLEQWVRLFEDERHIGEDQIGDVNVSTVWMGVGTGEPPLIFETMIFGGPHNHETWRYATEQKARAGHARAVALVAGTTIERGP